MADNSLGFDPSTIQGLLAQFANTDDDKKRAITQALATAGFGILGAKGMSGVQAIGQGGLLGMNAYNGALDDAGTQKKTALSNAMGAMNLQEGLQKFKDADLLRQQQQEFAAKFANPTAAAPPAAPAAPAAPQGLLGGMSADGMGPPTAPPPANGMSADGMGPPSLPAQSPPAAPVAAPAAPAALSGIPNKRQQAQLYQSQGDFWMQKAQPAKAQVFYDLAQKTLPQLKDTKDLTDANGNRVVVNFYNDGTQEVVPGVGPDKKEAHFLDTGSSIGAVDPFTGLPIKGGGLYNKVVTPGEQLSANVTMRGQNMTDARSKADATGTPEQFTPDAIANAASRYNIDGTLPPMGMGKSGVNARAAILNKAAELNQGVSGDDQRIAQIGNKANSAALTKLQSSQSMIGAFEKNFNKNADMTLDLSKQVDNTGIPLANKWINAGKRAVTGDPQLSAYDLSIKATVNEYAKIISGSMGNTPAAEGEMKKVGDLLNAAQNDQQVAAVVQYMKKETANRMAGFDEEKASLRSSMKGGSATTSPTTPTVGWSVRKIN